MKYNRFEELPVWNDAMRLGAAAWDLVEDRAFTYKGDLRDQMQRSSLSISNNIAEGFESGTNKLLLKHLYIALGSAGETRSMLLFVLGRQSFAQLHPQAQRILEESRSVSRQLQKWSNSIHRSPLQGWRHAAEE
jgi:four helix bundle protein